MFWKLLTIVFYIAAIFEAWYEQPHIKNEVYSNEGLYKPVKLTLWKKLKIIFFSTSLEGYEKESYHYVGIFFFPLFILLLRLNSCDFLVCTHYSWLRQMSMKI